MKFCPPCGTPFVCPHCGDTNQVGVWACSGDAGLTRRGKPMKTITISLCCNDSQGDLESLHQVEVSDLLKLHGDLFGGDGEKIRFAPDKSAVFINDNRYPIKGYKPWVGNVCWDEVRMSLEEAARLLNHLRELPHWTAFEGVCELFQAFEDGLPVTPEMLERVELVDAVGRG